MSIAHRSTLVVHGRLAMREGRLAAGRDGRHGLQVMSFEQAAVRLSGGFTRPIDDESLRAAIQAALPTTPMGELESIKALPGMIDAAVDTLHKAWRAGIDLAARAADHPRLGAIARLEAAVHDQLPSGMMRPLDIVAAASARIGHAPAVLGPMEITGLTELSPCWRPLLRALTAHIPVQWTAGPRSVPAWLDGAGVTISRAPAQAPDTSAVSAATAYHEAIEAMRWARSLLASGVSPAQIAIATASPADYDDHFQALRADANIDLHFVHGVRTVTTREGQAAAALADIVVRGLSQSRLGRLAALCRGFDKSIIERFRRDVQADRDLFEELERVCELFPRRRDSYPAEMTQPRNSLVARLRAKLSHACVDALQPDLIIMDEFQRFRDLLHGDSDAAILARERPLCRTWRARSMRRRSSNTGNPRLICSTSCVTTA
jgi:hypothetical protein